MKITPQKEKEILDFISQYPNISLALREFFMKDLKWTAQQMLATYYKLSKPKNEK